ncbi:hypothetical protein LY76DRAFT_39997 [Colletotrichum caudatum]|nr:hypothetical protein LY76DRAFT_39997 [Colletotrichum caudatum]
MTNALVCPEQPCLGEKARPLSKIASAATAYIAALFPQIRHASPLNDKTATIISPFSKPPKKHCAVPYRRCHFPWRKPRRGSHGPSSSSSVNIQPTVRSARRTTSAIRKSADIFYVQSMTPRPILEISRSLSGYYKTSWKSWVWARKVKTKKARGVFTKRKGANAGFNIMDILHGLHPSNNNFADSPHKDCSTCSFPLSDSAYFGWC